MRQSESQKPDLPGTGGPDNTEEKLRREIAALKRQLQEREAASEHASSYSQHTRVWKPSGIAITAIVLGIAAILAIGFLAGYMPMKKQQELVAQETQQSEDAPVRVDVIEVNRGSAKSELELPGNIQASTEAPILARADGYIKRRMVDIGDRVRAGQPLAEIEAPEVDQQIRQARAALQQAQAAQEQSTANLAQGKATMELARVTADRWSALAAQGVVSKQENDQYQAQYQAQTANVQALEKAIAAQRSNVAAAEANLARLDEVQSYRVVKAPFDGVITLRNVDVGALVNTGNTLLFRIAQIGTLRMYVNVPETSANSIHVGQPASLTVARIQTVVR